MINDLHKRAIEMWVYIKLNDSETNPSLFILEQITGQKIDNFESEPQNTIQLCQKLNKINGLDDLTEEEKVEIQEYGIQCVESNKGSKNIMLLKAMWLRWLNWIGYLLGLISMGITGFSWWILGFGIATWWAYGAAKLGAQKQNHEPGPSWEMPLHLIIHVIALLGLFGFSVFNMLN